ncbi:MAG TPA: Dot/Icm T4SS effector AnkH/LegA3 [Gammaproteobacteria bacterium]|nr:Dot/Icm T4SS effector AnkH/LegA3 [Gammaproteobacteria bacterium]
MNTLVDAILQEDTQQVRLALRYTENINELDEYGFTPLIESAIVDHLHIAKILLEAGAKPNVRDVTGGTALHWAAENNHLELCQLLLSHGANPDAVTLAGQPVLVMPVLRQQQPLRQLLIQSGANLRFAQDYINAKLLGHMYELVGHASVVSPKQEFVEVDFEGFILEITVGLIAESVHQFQNHFAARKLRRYANLAKIIVEVLQRGSQLIKYQQYQTDRSKFAAKIESILKQDPLLIPVGYEGHAITFIRYGNVWVKCDRREDSRLYDNVMIYHIGNPQALTAEFLASLIYQKQSSDFINEVLDRELDLQPITEIKVDAQISGNCSWANVEATIPALFFLLLSRLSEDPSAHAYYKTLALNFFHRWREWNKDRALHQCLKRFQEGDLLHKAAQAEILSAILFQSCDVNRSQDQARIQAISAALIGSKYEYVLRDYVQVYYYKGITEEGKHFLETLKSQGFEETKR